VKLGDCQDVAGAADLQTLESRLVRFANDLEFGIICGVFVVEPAVGPASIQYIGNTPEEFQSQSRNSPLRKRDPVASTSYWASTESSRCLVMRSCSHA